MKKTTYVIGPRNPDTDSIVSAIAYAELKRQQGWQNCFPARAGKITPQTEYILDRFKIPTPEYIPDLVPKVGYYLAGPPTSIRLLLQTLKAQPVLTFNADAVVKSRILVAASSTASFKKHLESEMPSNALVVTGDREEVQRHSIEQGARAVIITSGMPLAKGLRELAEERGVSVMISPYDTSSTAFLILYSTPVSFMADEQAKPVNANSYVRSIREVLAETPSRCLPVVDDAQVVVGVFSESDLIKEPNIDIIMVDHNELSQAVEGLDNYRILEILDHHRLGNFSTRYPITFINRVVGATNDLIGRKAELLEALAAKRAAGELYFAALMITDITALSSVLLIDGEREFVRRIVFPKIESGIYMCRDILSRKKQLIPLLMEQMESVLGA